MRQIILRARRRSCIHHCIHLAFDLERPRNIPLVEFESAFIRQVYNILPTTGQKIVEPDHGVAIRQKAIAQMRPDKPGGAGDDYPQVTPNGLF